MLVKFSKFASCSQNKLDINLNLDKEYFHVNFEMSLYVELKSSFDFFKFGNLVFQTNGRRRSRKNPRRSQEAPLKLSLVLRIFFIYVAVSGD